MTLIYPHHPLMCLLHVTLFAQKQRYKALFLSEADCTYVQQFPVKPFYIPLSVLFIQSRQLV